MTENGTQRATRVSIVDDHIIVSEMLALSISKESDLALAGTASNSVEAIRLIKRELPDVLLMNYLLPYGDCIETIKQISVDSPKTRVVLLSPKAEHELMARAKTAGVVGFLDKDSSIADVLAAIRAAARGDGVPLTNAYSPS